MKHKTALLSAALALTVVCAAAASAFIPPRTDAGNPALHRVLLEKLLGGKKQQQQAVDPNVHPIHDDATFDAAKKTFSVVPYGRTEMEFAIDLPNDWEPLTSAADPAQALTQKILGDVAKFQSPMISTVRATVTVQVLYPEHEISAKNWLKNYILVNGFAPDGDVTEKNKYSASAAFVSTTNMTSYHTYATVQISGNSIMLARFDIPLTFRSYVDYLQKKTIDSFRMLTLREGKIEPQKTFTLADALKVEYPASWTQASSSLQDLNRLNMRLTNRNPNGQIDGLINITAIRRSKSTNLKKELETFKKDVTETVNFDFVQMNSSEKSPAYNRFVFNRYETYDIQGKRANQSPQEMHLVVLGDNQFYIIIYLITPKEASNLYTWARNTQTFDHIVRGVR